GGGNAGVIANDYWGGNDGIYTNTTLGQPGYSSTTDTETSAQFGLTAFVDSDAFSINNVSFAAGSGSPGVSVEAWVKGSTQTTDAGIATKAVNGSEQFSLDCGGPSHGFRFLLRDNGGTAHSASSAVQPANLWHHLVGVSDQVNGVVTLYVDGAA